MVFVTFLLLRNCWTFLWHFCWGGKIWVVFVSIVRIVFCSTAWTFINGDFYNHLFLLHTSKGRLRGARYAKHQSGERKHAASSWSYNLAYVNSLLACKPIARLRSRLMNHEWISASLVGECHVICDSSMCLNKPTYKDTTLQSLGWDGFFSGVRGPFRSPSLKLGDMNDMKCFPFLGGYPLGWTYLKKEHVFFSNKTIPPRGWSSTKPFC